MATPKSQRIGILIIATVMLVGTIGSFAVMVLANQNARDEVAEQNKLLEEYRKQLEQKEKEAEELSKTYYPKFKKYQDSPAEFDEEAAQKEVATKDLVEGTGVEIKEETTYQAYYIGWTPRGTVFDSSFQSDKLKAPLDTSQMTLIPGWQQGVVGMRVGGVRQITIPSDLAYGETGSGKIPANTPIRFIVMIIAAN